MVYEVIGKVALYIIRTLIFGAFTSAIDDTADNWGIFFGRGLRVSQCFWN